MTGFKKGKVTTYDERMIERRLAEIERRQKEAKEDDPQYEIDNFYKNYNEEN